MSEPMADRVALISQFFGRFLTQGEAESHEHYEPLCNNCLFTSLLTSVPSYNA